MKSFYSYLFLLFILSSCVSKKNIVYFQANDIDQSKVSNKYKTIFKPDDLLQITISAKDQLSVRPFNLIASNFTNSLNEAVGQIRQQEYLVDSKGEIDFPILGKIKLGGVSRENAIKMLKSKLDPKYVINPNINIRIINFKVSVLGEVNRPGTFTIPNERITILEAIGLAGDLKISGERYNIKIYREEEGKKNEYIIDLRSRELFTSPIYYLQQNDMIYVEPNYASSQSAAYNQNTGLFISIGSIIVSLFAVLGR